MKKVLCSVISAALCGTALLPSYSSAQDAASKFNSSFIRNWNCRSCDKERWEQEFNAAKLAGFDSLILQSILDIRYDISNGNVQENFAPEIFCMFPFETAG